jgi:hypothetical protein
MIRKAIDQANKELQSAANGGESLRRGEVSNSAQLPPPRQREKVLIVIRQGRFISAYCQRDDIDFLFVNEPDTSPENGLLGEMLMDQALPKVYRDIHCQGYVRGVGEAQHINAADVQWTIGNVKLIDALALSRPAAERVTPNEALRAGLGVSR